jgi:hypothetical protein
MKKASLNKIAKIQDKLSVIADALESLTESEREAFNRRSDKYKESDDGQTHDNAILDTESALNCVYEAINMLGNVETNID